jgi:hypothetical protein
LTVVVVVGVGMVLFSLCCVGDLVIDGVFETIDLLSHHIKMHVILQGRYLFLWFMYFVHYVCLHWNG